MIPGPPLPGSANLPGSATPRARHSQGHHHHYLAHNITRSQFESEAGLTRKWYAP